MARTYGLATPQQHHSLRLLQQSFFHDNNKADGAIRRHFARMLAPARLGTETAAIRLIRDRLLEKHLRTAAAGSLTEFSVAYALAILGALLGISADLLTDLPAVSTALLAALDCRKLSLAELADLDARTEAAAAAFFEFFQSERARDSECVLGLLQIARQYELSLESAFSDLLFVLTVGFQSTASLIAEVFWHLTRNPQTVETLLTDSQHEPGAVDEFIRLFPSAHFVTRWVDDNVNIQGIQFARSDTVIVIIPAANRDPNVYPLPGTFMLGRPGHSRSLSFSGGSHRCIGAALAQYELDIALEAFLQHRGALLLANSDAPRWQHLGVFRVLEPSVSPTRCQELP